MDIERVVVDASAGVEASLANRWGALDGSTLVAPTLFWSEVASAINQLHYRREISVAEAASGLKHLLDAEIEPYPSRELVLDARELAAELGWAKTYDAEFVVLARRIDASLLTVDARLAATAARFVRLHPASR